MSHLKLILMRHFIFSSLFQFSLSFSLNFLFLSLSLFQFSLLSFFLTLSLSLSAYQKEREKKERGTREVGENESTQNFGKSDRSLLSPSFSIFIIPSRIPFFSLSLTLCLPFSSSFSYSPPSLSFFLYFSLSPFFSIRFIALSHSFPLSLSSSISSFLSFSSK